MPRPPRVEFPEALYHITVRGVLKSAIVRDDHDRVRWCDYLKAAVSRAGLELYAFALLDNHFHLFLSAPNANLGKAMQYLNGSYAAYFNARHERKGHLFESRYHGVLIESRGHYTEVSRYVHLNPVRAGIVKRPEDYAWSSYPIYHYARKPLPWLNYDRVLAEFFTGKPVTTNKGVRPLYLYKSGEGKEALERYRQFVTAGVGLKLAPPWARAVGGWLLGSPKFVAKTYAILAKDARGSRWDSRASHEKDAVDATLDEIAAAVRKEFRVTPEQLKSNGKYRGRARGIFIFLARYRSCYSLKSIGAYLGMPSPGNVFRLGRNVEERIREDGDLRKLVTRLESGFASK